MLLSIVFGMLCFFVSWCQLGDQAESFVTIEANDKAHGMFKVYSADPQASNDGHLVAVQERSQYSVELIIERQGSYTKKMDQIFLSEHNKICPLCERH